MSAKPVREKILKGKSPVKCDWLRPHMHTSNLAYHRDVEFHYIKKGEGFYFIQNRRYPFSKNNVMAIKSGEIHKFIRQSSFVEKGTLYFPLSFLKTGLLKNIVRECPHVTALAEKEAMLAEIMLKNIAGEIESKKSLWEEIVYSWISQFLLMIKRASGKRPKKTLKNTVAENLIEYIEGNFTRDVSLPEIAKKFSLSASRISHIFKEETSMGVKHYILQRRIVEAKKLLEENSSMKVAVISAKVGFGNFALFNRIFKKVTGLTPSNYRRLSREGKH